MSSGYIAKAKSVEWTTPKKLFEFCVRHFGEFELDLAATKENALAPRFFDEHQDALTQEWSGLCWCNPPYGRGIAKWVDKAIDETSRGKTTEIVMLLPARTGVKWFYKLFVNKAARIYFIKGRLHYGDGTTAAGFDSMIVWFLPFRKRPNMFLRKFEAIYRDEGGDWCITDASPVNRRRGMELKPNCRTESLDAFIEKYRERREARSKRKEFRDEDD